MRVAAVTMIYNEPIWARVWVRHYARQVGAENCLILDHGSTDGSTHDLGIQVERLERSTLDETLRAKIVSDRVARLLQRYDAVVHTDADELLVADPQLYPDLRAYAAAMPDVVTAFGLDLQHLPDEEVELDPTRPLGRQRCWVRFSGAMCKPAMVRRAVQWQQGFHGCDAPHRFGPVYLIHLRYADLKAGLVRLAKTRGLAFASADTNLHQRVEGHAFDSMVRAIAKLPRLEGSLALDGVLAKPWAEAMREGWEKGEPQLSLAGDVLWRLPPGILSAL